MEHIYLRIQRRARQIAYQYPVPDFYQDFPLANHLSRRFFDTNPVICRLKRFVAEHLEENFGHGFAHARKVTSDAGALILIECKNAGYDDAFIQRRLLIVQCAGLLHDIKRKEKDHAVRGALYAREVLKDYPLFPHEIEDVCQAIRNHEAFKEMIGINTPEGMLVSDTLYDADKFRWGPDNFTDTVWQMVSFSQTPFVKFVDFYPRGMEMLENIKKTFRSDTGKKYGPQFIDIGLAIGKELYQIIKTEFYPNERFRKDK